MSNDSQQQPGKLFVGGLSFSTTDVTLRQYFEAFGAVKEAVVMRDPATHRSRGFGFVTFHSASVAESCLHKSNHIIDGRQVEAKRATPREDASARTNASANTNGSTSNAWSAGRSSHTGAKGSNRDRSSGRASGSGSGGGGGGGGSRAAGHRNSSGSGDAGNGTGSKGNSGGSGNKGKGGGAMAGQQGKAGNRKYTAESEVTKDRKIFVGGLHYDTTPGKSSSDSLHYTH